MDAVDGIFCLLLAVFVRDTLVDIDVERSVFVRQGLYPAVALRDVLRRAVQHPADLFLLLPGQVQVCRVVSHHVDHRIRELLPGGADDGLIVVHQAVHPVLAVGLAVHVVGADIDEDDGGRKVQHDRVDLPEEVVGGGAADAPVVDRPCDSGAHGHLRDGEHLHQGGAGEQDPALLRHRIERPEILHRAPLHCLHPFLHALPEFLQGILIRFLAQNASSFFPRQRPGTVLNLRRGNIQALAAAQKGIPQGGCRQAVLKKET